MRLLAFGTGFEKASFIASEFIGPFGVSSQEAIENGHCGMEGRWICRLVNMSGVPGIGERRQVAGEPLPLPQVSSAIDSSHAEQVFS